MSAMIQNRPSIVPNTTYETDYWFGDTIGRRLLTVVCVQDGYVNAVDVWDTPVSYSILDWVGLRPTRMDD